MTIGKFKREDSLEGEEIISNKTNHLDKEEGILIITTEDLEIKDQIDIRTIIIIDSTIIIDNKEEDLIEVDDD